MFIISQHSFCPLGFIPYSAYDDTMVLMPSPTHSTTILSPCYGSSFVEFFITTSSYTRFWRPLVKSNSFSFSSISLKDTFLFARSYFASSLSFNVTCLNY